jgi:hypothetical protein
MDYCFLAEDQHGGHGAAQVDLWQKRQCRTFVQLWRDQGATQPSYDARKVSGSRSAGKHESAGI